MAFPILTLGFVAFVFYQLTLVFHRLFFHPLAKFPGPRIAAASRWYEFWVDVLTRGRYAWTVERMHEKYGPIVRVTPYEVHIDDPTWSRVILSGPGHVRDKDPALASAIGSPFGTFGTVSHHLHSRRRVPIEKFFSKRVIATHMQDTLWDLVESLCDALVEAHQKSHVVRAQLTFLAWATDSLTACSFGERLGLMKDESLTIEHLNVFRAFGALFPILKQCLWIIPLALRMPVAPLRIIFPPLATILDVHVEMGKFAQRVCAEDELRKDKVHDAEWSVFQRILDSDLPADEKSPDRISHEGLEVLLAGGYTTGKAISLIIFFVLADPQLESALRQEIRGAMPDAYQHVDLAVLQELPLLSAIIKEALRIGVISHHRLSLIANETLTYKEWVIPAGTRVSTTPAANGLDPAFFPEPHKFDPYRWMNCDKATLQMMNQTSLPFAAGTRGCLGMHFAYAELYIGTASIFRRFHLELYDTIRERDIDHNWTHLTAEPAHGSKGLRFRVTGVTQS